MKTLAVFLENKVSCFRPTDAQITLLSSLLAPAWRILAARSQDEFTCMLAEADAAIVWTFHQEWFALAPHLRLLCTPAAGKDYFHVSPPSGVALRYGSFHGSIMGETAAACVLSLSHGLFKYCSAMTSPSGASGASSWPRPQLDSCSRRLAGRKCAILGFGAIGSAAAKFLKPFGARIAGISRHKKPHPAFFTDGDETYSKEDMVLALDGADFLLCFLPRSPETDGIVGETVLGMLPPGAFLLNFGRGNAVDEDALCAALHSGRLCGAVLDVYNEEPLPKSSKLRTAPNIWLFPHSSAFSPDYLDLYFLEISKSLVNIL